MRHSQPRQRRIESRDKHQKCRSSFREKNCSIMIIGVGLLLFLDPVLSSSAVETAVETPEEVVVEKGHCFTAVSAPSQGLCTGTYHIKVCAKTQELAQAYVDETHGIIVKANCKRALTILCGDVGGGNPNDDLSSVCCKVANQCETDEDCGDHSKPAEVPLCCDYCIEMYREACSSSEPVGSGFMSVENLYHAFYGTDIYQKCYSTSNRLGHACVETANGTRVHGHPCLGPPADSHEAESSDDSGTTRTWHSPRLLVSCLAVALMLILR